MNSKDKRHPDTNIPVELRFFIRKLPVFKGKAINTNLPLDLMGSSFNVTTVTLLVQSRPEFNWNRQFRSVKM